MKLKIIIIASLIMLGNISGEISSKSSPASAPAPDSAVNAADSPPSPAESPIVYSSPPEPETEHSPSPSPTPSNSPSISPPLPDNLESPPSAPSPSASREASDLNHSDITGIENEEKSTGRGGMRSGTKVGVAFGVIAAVCVVGVAGFVYKKRQGNIRRSRYGYAARDIL